MKWCFPQQTSTRSFLVFFSFINIICRSKYQFMTSFTTAHTHQHTATQAHPGQQYPFHTLDGATCYRPTAAPFTSVFQRVQGCTRWGEARPEEHTQNGQQEPSSLSDTVFRLGWHSSSSGASPKLYQAESLQGRAGGIRWNGSRGLEAHLLVGRGTPFPSHNSPGLL